MEVETRKVAKAPLLSKEVAKKSQRALDDVLGTLEDIQEKGGTKLTEEAIEELMLVFRVISSQVSREDKKLGGKIARLGVPTWPRPADAVKAVYRAQDLLGGRSAELRAIDAEIDREVEAEFRNRQSEISFPD